MNLDILRTASIFADLDEGELARVGEEMMRSGGNGGGTCRKADLRDAQW